MSARIVIVGFGSVIVSLGLMMGLVEVTCVDCEKDFLCASKGNKRCGTCTTEHVRKKEEDRRKAKHGRSRT